MRNTIPWTVAAVLAWGLVGGGEVARGQQSRGGSTPSAASSGGTSGLFGSRSLGSGISSSRSAVGSSGFNAGRSGGGQNSAANANSSAGQITGNERFVRGSRQGAFVGADNTDTRDFFQAIAGNAMRGQGGAGPGQFQQNRGDNNGNGNSRTDRSRYRVIRELGFEAPRPAPSAAAGQWTTRLNRSLGARAVSGVDVTVQDQRVVLRGVVATEHDREIAERLLMLEPGVGEVENLLTVAAPAGDSPAGAK